jgi:simple sugar transport system ATP-binding protein
VLWRDLDCAPHPGHKVGCRLSTVTVHARSRRSTPTTFKPAPGDHVIDVFIAPCCRIPSQGASRPASSGASHPASLAPRVNQTLFMDEPTAALGVVQTQGVLDLIRRVRDAGKSVVLISHNIPQVLEVADRIIVLRLGRTVGQVAASDVTVDDLIRAMTSGELRSSAK